MGTAKVSEIMLANIHMIDTYQGKKIKRTENGVNHDAEGFYSSEARIFLDNTD